MRTIQQQHFLPASKGLITSASPSLIADGAFQEVNNVRFGDGYIEKVKAFTEFTDLKEQITHIVLFHRTDGYNLNIIHTPTKVYSISEDNPSGVNIMSDADYEVPSVNFIDSTILFNNYIFCSLGNPLYYWDGLTGKASQLDGLIYPTEWKPSTTYEVGVRVRPTDSKYTGYIYKCTVAGTSSSSEPTTWGTTLKAETLDGTVKWVAIGGLEVEGTSARAVTASCIENYKGFVFVANTEEDGEACPQRLRWSQFQSITLWHNNKDGSGMAGYVDCNDTAGIIYAIKKLNDYLYIYKDDGILAISYSGGDTVFSKDTVTTEAGLIAPRAIVCLPHQHIFVGNDNIYSFDGSTVKAIGDSVKDMFFNNLDPANIRNIYGYYNEDSGDVLFTFDSQEAHGLSQDKAVTYNTRTKQWSMRDMNMTAIGQYSQFSDQVIDEVSSVIDDDKNIIDSAIYAKGKTLTIAGDNSGKVYKLGGYSDSRGDYEAYVITKVHHMENPSQVKRLLRVMFHIETQNLYNLKVQIGTAWNAETEMTWSKPLYMDLHAPKPPWLDMDLTARYFAVRFGTTGNLEPFKILGYTLMYQTRSDE